MNIRLIIITAFIASINGVSSVSHHAFMKTHDEWKKIEAETLRHQPKPQPKQRVKPQPKPEPKQEKKEKKEKEDEEEYTISWHRLLLIITMFVVALE